MSAPTEEQLLAAVAGLRVSLLSYDPDAANDAADLSRKIKDDHFTWKTGAEPDDVARVLAQIQASEKPPYNPPPELFPLDVGLGPQSIPVQLSSIHKTGISNLNLAGIHHAQGGVGSKGSYILFLHPADGGTTTTGFGLVVLKESNPDFINEVFAANMFRACGLVSPQFMKLRKDEFVALTDKLRNTCVTIKGTCGALHESRAQESGGVLMEFLSGTVLPQAMKLNAPSQFEDLGKCLAVDMLVNNFDRTPLVWSHHGNASNLLVTSTRLHFIDQSLTRITDEELFVKYTDKIRDCMKEFKTKKVGGPYGERLRAFFKMANGSEMSDANLQLVFASCVKMCEIFIKDIDTMLDAVVKDTKAGVGAGRGFTADIPIEFCKMVVRKGMAVGLSE